MKFTIVGGGTAGWIAAYKIIKKVPLADVTVIESSSIPIVGVGEGSTGKLTDMLVDPDMGLDEFEFMQKTWALPKYGIKFSGWTKDTSKEFYSPIEGSVTEGMMYDVFLYNSVLKDDDIAHASISGFYYKDSKIPWFVKEGNLHYIGGRAYHIDAYKVGEFFKEKCLGVGVRHIDAKVTDVIVKDETITSISLDSGESINSDVFIDCTGFAKVLMSKLKNEWVDRKDHLPVDRALIFKVINDKSTKQPYTAAKAQKHGWIFEIPTRHKTGRGYIYSSRFSDDQVILDELKELYGEVETVQQIKFSTGTYKDFWVGNCIVLGLASGFLEPLQATSLHISFCQLEKLIRDVFCQENIPLDDMFVKNDFNSYCRMLTTDMLDFVQATYTGGREDSPFWHYMTNEAKKSERLQMILHLAKTRLIRFHDFIPYDGYAGQALWAYTLAGLGHFDKNTIKQVMKSANIDLQSLDVDYEIFKEQMISSLSNKMTCDELNNLFLKGEEKKLPIHKIY